MNLSRTTLGYCTNVHPGTTLAAIQENLTRHALPIRDQLQRKQLLGVGLWVPRQASDELVRDARRCAQFRDWLADHDLKPYTINGFPYDNFHQPVVKHAVYLPTWWQRERLEYTKQLVTILDHLLPPGETGSISTMPIAWGSPAPSQEQLVAAARHLQQLADYLDDLETRTGRRIVIAIEPEPGCYLQTTEGLVRFFDRYLQLDQHRRYLTVCHDVCHADVMNESQAACMSAYRDAQIGVGKIQVSAAIEVDWQALTSDHDRREALRQLAGFAEDRYLHQTGRITLRDQFVLEEDLPAVLKAQTMSTDLRWRIHFHMPIFLQQFGALKTTQPSIRDCLAAIVHEDAPEWTGHYEVETYAWSVIPAELRPTSLADGIAKELNWLDQLITRTH